MQTQGFVQPLGFVPLDLVHHCTSSIIDLRETVGLVLPALSRPVVI